MTTMTHEERARLFDELAALSPEGTDALDKILRGLHKRATNPEEYPDFSAFADDEPEPAPVKPKRTRHEIAAVMNDDTLDELEITSICIVAALARGKWLHRLQLEDYGLVMIQNRIHQVLEERARDWDMVEIEQIHEALLRGD